MKNAVMLLVIFTALNICAEGVVCLNQTLQIPVSGLSVEAISYTDEVEVEEGIVPANWSVVIQIELNRGTHVEINGEPVVLDRLREYYTMRLSVEDMQDLLGENYEAVLFVVENGDYLPDGEVAAALIAQAALQLGASGE